jgi:hypothetical protein
MCMYKKCVCLISLVFLLGMVGNVSAAVTYNQYSGPTNGDWNTAANWALGHVPTTAEKAGFKTVGGPLVAASTPACGEWTLGGTAGGIITINTGGTVSTVTSGGGTGRVVLGQAAGENGTLTMNGGTATFAGILDLGYAGTGLINLYGGTINAADFAMRSTGGVGTMDITAGTLIITGDKVSLINGYVTSGWITAYDGSGTVNVSYDTPNAGKTTVTATSGGGSGTVYPYLTYRNSPTNSIVVNWWNPNGTGDSSVNYGLTSSYGSTTNVATVTNYHHVELTGLATGTTYHYRIRSNDGTVGADNTFTTAAANATSFGFAAFGDGRGIAGDSTLYYARHQALCDWIAAQNNIKFVLDSGDIVWEGASTTSLVDYWPDYFQLESNLSKSKVKMNTLGNHEVQPTGAGTPLERYQNYKNFYAAGFPANGVGGDYEGQVYSFNYGNAHFVCLSSYQAPFAAQTTWLAADLAAASADPGIQWIFVWMHDPMYTTSSTHPPDTTEQAWWGPIFDQYQVDIVFAGHNHVYERSKSLVNGAVVPDGQGTVYITNGLAGANFDPISSHPLFVTSYNSQTLATCVTINGNNLTVNAITNVDGIVRDTFTLSHGALPLPGQAGNPSPANGAANVATNATLSWTAGSDAASHDVYFGTTSPGTSRGNQTATTYNPGTLANSTTYYWRINEKNATGTTTGAVWSFTTAATPQPPAKAASPSPANGATGVSITNDLSWSAGSGATSHDVYFGTTSPGTSRGNQTATTYDTGTMANNTTYYWRIDEKNAAGTTTGDVWSFITVTAAPGALPFSDGFESGNFTAGGWTTQDADASITSTTNDRYAGTYGAKVRQTTWIQKAVSTVGYNTIHVLYARKATGLDSGQNEKLFVEWSIDGTTWYNLETVPTAAWALKDFTCGSGANNNANFRVRFRINADATSEFGAVDSVQITGTSQ